MKNKDIADLVLQGEMGLVLADYKTEEDRVKKHGACQCKVVVQNDGIGIHCRCVRQVSTGEVCTQCQAGEHFTVNYAPITLRKEPRRRRSVKQEDAAL
jgi:hypothetical protein